jgi:predicted ATPase
LRTLVTEHRLVTVAGAGGIGKTRLAQGVAAALADAQQDGVWWVELAGPERPGPGPGRGGPRPRPVPHLEAADATRAVLAGPAGQDRAMLVLDNAEHLVEGVAAFIGALGERLSGLRLLVTSQEVLRTAGEQVFRPGPLALPTDDDLLSARASGAVALFVARARQVNPRFELDEDNRAAVVDICRRLDGIPLAIELAAARVPLLGVDGLRARLDERFQVLTAGARAVMRRHQTLRAALEWSHALLDAPEQVVFRRLGVFAGGFTLEAAQDVVEDEGLDRWDVLEHLGALVDKSLVAAEGDALPRYRLLETTRLYALERLADAAETQTLLRRHAQCYLALAEIQDADISAHGRGANALALLDLERDNLLHAMAWCDRDAETQAAAVGLRLAAALRYYWPSRALLALGTRLTLAALAHSSMLPADEHRSKALFAAAHMSALMGQYDQARELSLENLAMSRQIGYGTGVASALVQLGHRATDDGRLEEAEVHFREGMEQAKTLGHLRLQAAALNGLIVLATGGRRPDDVAALGEQALALQRHIGQRYNLATTLLNVALAHVDHDKPALALPLLQEAATLVPDTGSQLLAQLLVMVAAPVLARQVAGATIVRLYAAASVNVRRQGASPMEQLQRHEQRDLAAAREQLGAAAFDAAWVAGQTLDAEAAFRLAATALADAAVEAGSASVAP